MSFSLSNNTGSFQYCTGLTDVTGPNQATNSPIFNGIQYTLYTTGSVAYLTTTQLPTSQNDFNSCICNYQFANNNVINNIIFGPVHPGMYAVSCYNNLNPTSTSFGQWTGLLTLVPYYTSITYISPYIGGIMLSTYGQNNNNTSGYME